MTDIKILRLSLENFKCHSSLHLDLRGKDASIYGDNATGKTSIYDALTWLLFGKDSAGNGEKNMEVKPLDSNGEVKDHDALTAVEAQLEVDGEELTLRRTYKEVWTTKRGSSTATYDGNTSEYYVNGVPCKKNAFQDKVNELVSEDTFRMLTNVSYFASQISWQDRRAVLFKLAGVMDDKQIMETDERFALLAQSAGKLSLEDYKKKLLAEKRKFVGAKTEIPARISECQKTITDTEALDFAAAKAELDVLNGQKERISAQILAIEHDRAAEQKNMEIREAQMAMQMLENENRVYRASQQIEADPAAGSRTRQNHLQVKLSDLRTGLSRLKTSLTNKRNTLSFTESNVANLDKEISYSRDRWKRLNSEIFTGGKCVTCGQTLPADQLQKAVDAFEAQKKKRLNEIKQTADAQKANKAQAEQRITEIRAEVSELEEQIAVTEDDIRTAELGIEEAKEAYAKAKAEKPEPQDMEDYAQRRAAINSRIECLNEDLFEMMEAASDVKDRLDMELAETNRQIRAQMEVISKESLLEYSRQRIEELRQDAKNAAECLDAIEKMLYLLDQYSRYKTQFVEDSINGLFRIARFRLFREQANGGVEDRCDVMYDGVPYTGLNNGMKVNVGIDIINTISVAYGIHVPLFVDNAESVTKLWSCGSQIIRLVVSENDKELRVSYED